VVELPADRLRPGQGERRAGQDRHRLAEHRRRQVGGHPERVGDLLHAAGVVALEVAQLLQGQQVGPFALENCHDRAQPRTAAGLDVPGHELHVC
jgi:hypothetical protein